MSREELIQIFDRKIIHSPAMIADYILDNYISKADHQKLIDKTDADEMLKISQLLEKHEAEIKKAQAKIIDDLLAISDEWEREDLLYYKDEIISDNTEGEEPMQSVSELVGDDNINNQKL